jgi:hypothetical protein
MPYDEPDETDPMLLVGVELDADEAATLESARVFADEFAQLGFDETRLLAVFRSPAYAGPHRAHRILGEAKVGEIVREYVGFWSAVRFRERDSDPDAAGLRLLPTLNVPAWPGHGEEH